MIVLLVVLANLADLFTFICAASVLPISGELNPLARMAYIHAGITGVAVLKLGGVAVTLLIIGIISEPLIRNICISFAITMAMFGAAANTFSVVVSR